MLSPAALIVLYFFALARLTRLVVIDEISAPARRWIVARLNPASRAHRAAAYALGSIDDDGRGCPWCMSMWLAAVTAPAVWHWHTSSIIAVVVLALAASQIASMITVFGLE